MKILITGYKGLLGTHVRAKFHAINGSAIFKGQERPFEIVLAGRDEFSNTKTLECLISGCDVILHFAGVNRGEDKAVVEQNRTITSALVESIRATDTQAHVIFANSTHRDRNSAYGSIKRETGATLSSMCASCGAKFTDLILPNVFGELSKPFYNTVTATLCQKIIEGNAPELNPEGMVELLHAGVVADRIVDLIESGEGGQVRMDGDCMSVPELYQRLYKMHKDYANNLMPALNDRLTLLLFNTLRSFMYPDFYPHKLYVHSDTRGDLFETVRGGGGGQTFLSWTEPGVTRGNHFHRFKVERFVVVSGEAMIRIRQIFTGELLEFPVSGKVPCFIDMPTLFTHSIENTGTEPLLTQFWSHEVFNPEQPDTYADPVIQSTGNE